MKNENESEAQYVEFVVKLRPELLQRIEALASEPSLGFENAEHVAIAAILSFLRRKEAELFRRERDGA